TLVWTLSTPVSWIARRWIWQRQSIEVGSGLRRAAAGDAGRPGVRDRRPQIPRRVRKSGDFCYGFRMSTAASKRAPDPAVVEAIQQILREKLSSFGYRGATIVPGEDHDGDPVLFVEAEYELSEVPVDSTKTLEAQVEVWNKLTELGEERFPHVRHHFHDDQ